MIGFSWVITYVRHRKPQRLMTHPNVPYYRRPQKRFPPSKQVSLPPRFVFNNDVAFINLLSPKDFYSTLAGFVEPSEAFEDSVKREIYEESGIRVRNVVYHSGQPWVRILKGSQLTFGRIDVRYPHTAIPCEPYGWFLRNRRVEPGDKSRFGY